MKWSSHLKGSWVGSPHNYTDRVKQVTIHCITRWKNKMKKLKMEGTFLKTKGRFCSSSKVWNAPIYGNNGHISNALTCLVSVIRKGVWLNTIRLPLRVHSQECSFHEYARQTPLYHNPQPDRHKWNNCINWCTPGIIKQFHRESTGINTNEF